jgi:hypothetical protein
MTRRKRRESQEGETMSGRNTNKTAKHQMKRTRIEYHGNIEHRLNQVKEFPTYPYLALNMRCLFFPQRYAVHVELHVCSSIPSVTWQNKLLNKKMT